MNWLVYHIVSGQAFFSGVALLITAAMTATQSRHIFKRIAILLFLIGITAIVVSSTAISYLYYLCAGCITSMWVAAFFVTKWRRWATYAVVTTWFVGALLESPYWVMPSLSPASSRSITVIGDSVTAGVGGDEKAERWPGILAREHALQVQDISHMGDTAASALKRVRTQGVNSSVVVVEIGGNDLLGSTSSTQFAQDLDTLLDYITRSGRQIIMFELPLPPFCHEYGRIQRTLARKYNVKLVPKRVFLSIIAGTDATLDSIHLSPAGHQQMADCVWRIVQAAFQQLPVTDMERDTLTEASARHALITLLEGKAAPNFDVRNRELTALKKGENMLILEPHSKSIRADSWNCDFDEKWFSFNTMIGACSFECNGVFDYVNGRWLARVTGTSWIQVAPNSPP